MALAVRRLLAEKIVVPLQAISSATGIESDALWKRLKSDLNADRLGVTFDVIDGESNYSKAALELLDRLRTESRLQSREDGVLGIHIPGEGGEEDCFVPLAKSDGSSLYLTRDVVAAVDRKNRYKFDVAYYVHVPFGRIRGMSSRRGEMVLLEELLDEARARAARAMEATNTTRVSGEEETEAAAEALGLAGVVANALRSRRGRDVVFDWDQALHARGDSGLTLQYAHARLCSLEEKADCPLDLKCDTSVLHEPSAIALSVELAKFEDAVFGALVELEPCIVVQYLYSLRQGCYFFTLQD
ncbi:hypothetical protein HPB47_010112 [Ixodes persulcatus]|uniref:Uncharacterized protein n=1 Tax=Ixodes persulcatus TaxID=34615 RepID=A0AC60P007_IXOPE|nr:hypothetical protein HPB47_010112 [Ixodes persulcatus]